MTEKERRRKKKLQQREKYKVKNKKEAKKAVDTLFDIAQTLGPYLAEWEEKEKRLESNEIYQC